MMKKNSPKRICILCEGFEEFDYITKLNSLGVWDSAYTITVKNAKGLDNIAPVYQNEFHSDNFDLIVIFCDTELPPYMQFRNLIKKIDAFHDKKVSKNIVFFSNPCSMQVILSHFEAVSLTTNSKVLNTPLISKFTGLNHYSARREQRARLMSRINAQNYAVMRANISSISTNFRENPSSNFLSLALKLECPNTGWVTRLARRIDG